MLLLLLHSLLQVLDIATGTPLLPQPLTGCGEVLLWWGNSSDTLAFSTLAGDHNTQLRLLRLPAQQQQQVALLYTPQDGERGLDLQLTTDKQFVILSSSVEVRGALGRVAINGVFQTEVLARGSEREGVLCSPTGDVFSDFVLIAPHTHHPSPPGSHSCSSLCVPLTHRVPRQAVDACRG